MNQVQPSKYHGVSKLNGSYRVQIYRNRRVIYGGTYETEEAAANAYDRINSFTQAWAVRRASYNFPCNDGLRLKDEDLSAFELKILNSLREESPAQEDIAKEEQPVKDATPDILFEHLQNSRSAIVTHLNRIDNKIEELKQIFAKEAATRIAESTKNAWLTDQNKQLFEENNTLRLIPKTPTGQRVFKNMSGGPDAVFPAPTQP